MGTKYPTPFLDFFWSKNREREKGEERASKCFSLRSSEFHWLEFVESRTKIHLHDESYAWVPETKDSTEDSSEEFEKSRFRV